MTADSPVLTEAEVAVLLRVKASVVRAMGRRHEIVRVPPQRPPRYLRSSVERLLCEVHNGADAEPDRASSSEEASPRRGDRRPSQGSLESATVGGGGALYRRIGPTAGDVAVRRVPR